MLLIILIRNYRLANKPVSGRGRHQLSILARSSHLASFLIPLLKRFCLVYSSNMIDLLEPRGFEPRVEEMFELNCHLNLKL